MSAGRHIRFTAVLAGVVLALTGFSSGHGKHSSGGGGCSGSKTRHHSTTDDNSTRGSSTASPGPSTPPAHAVVVTCAGPGRPQAVLRVTSDVDGQRTVDVPLTFEGSAGTVDRTSVRVTLKPRETQTVTVPMTSPGKVSDVQRCQVGKIG
ncbi:hypothetical protein [Streptomyces sp. NPDC097981]|uniref:hypothetical protein n=1 Tax=Streptomyces sp. NPDC097981 TaxID=3155428 RepID=UPI00331C2DB4